MLKRNLEIRNEVIDSMEQIVELAGSELRPLTEEEIARIEELKEKLVGIDKSIETEKSVEDLKAPKEEIKVEEKIEEDAKEVAPEGEKRSMENMELRAMEEKAFVDAVKEGNVRALTAGANGGIIPTTISDRIVAKIVEISPLLSEAQIVNVKGSYRIVREKDALQANYVDEMVAPTEGVQTFETVVLNSFVIGALVKVSNSLVNNTDLDVVGYIVDRMAKAIAEKLEREILVGTTNKIEGISKVANKVTLAGAVPTIDELIGVQGQVLAKPEETMWIVSRTGLVAMRKMKDATGRPYMMNVMDTNGKFNETFLGAKVVVSDMLTGVDFGYLLAPKAVVVKYSKEVEINILKERYADQYATGVVGFVEADASFENDQQICKMVATLAKSK